MKFIVDRKHWDRGPHGKGMLYTGRNYCVIGFVCKSLGVSPKKMHELGCPESILNRHPACEETLKPIMREGGRSSQSWVDEAIELNDRQAPDETIEKGLKAVFADAGHTLVFKG